MKTKFALLVSACVLAFSANANAESTLAFTGGTITDDSYYAYVGGVTTLNYDIKTDGWLLRLTGAIGGYDYSTGAVDALTNIDGDVLASDLMVGYQKYLTNKMNFDSIRLTGYLGLDYQDHDLSPNDNLNEVRGDKVGVKGQLEFAGKFDDKISVNALGNYSTAFDTYWTRFNVGYSFGKFNVGPELLFMGSNSYNQQRLGVAFSDINLFNSVNLNLSGGYAAASGNADDSAYGEIGLSTEF